jgi:hypothetical protein
LRGVTVRAGPQSDQRYSIRRDTDLSRTGDERIRNGRSEDEDGTEDDSAKVTRVGRERRDGDEETGRSETDSTDGKRDTSSGLDHIVR